jgi:hypothetical protein
MGEVISNCFTSFPEETSRSDIRLSLHLTRIVPSTEKTNLPNGSKSNNLEEFVLVPDPLGLQLVSGGVTDLEDVDGVFTDGEVDSMLVFPLARRTVDQFADFLGELVVFRGQGATRRLATQTLDFLGQAIVPSCRDGL